MTCRRFILGRVVLSLGVIGTTAACQHALVYGERTSFDLAAVRVNDQVSEPIGVKIGFSRSIATAVPPRGGTRNATETKVAVLDSSGAGSSITAPGGEATSVFSDFDLTSKPDESGALLTPGTLVIYTRFASGQAAINVSGNTETVLRILGAGTVQLDSASIRGRKDKLTKCVTKIAEDNDQAALSALANFLGVTVSEDEPKVTAVQINTAIDRLSDSEKLATLEGSPPLVSCH